MRPVKRFGRSGKALGVAAVLMAALVLVSVQVGSFPLSSNEIWDILAEGRKGTTQAQVLWTLRLPRVWMGLLAGGALGLAGGVYQTLFGNPLASPDLTGVASGASLERPALLCWGPEPPPRSWGEPS